MIKPATGRFTKTFFTVSYMVRSMIRSAADKLYAMCNMSHFLRVVGEYRTIATRELRQAVAQAMEAKVQ